jgi:hypothetical protein
MPHGIGAMKIEGRVYAESVVLTAELCAEVKK